MQSSFAQAPERTAAASSPEAPDSPPTAPDHAFANALSGAQNKQRPMLSGSAGSPPKAEAPSSPGTSPAPSSDAPESSSAAGTTPNKDGGAPTRSRAGTSFSDTAAQTGPSSHTSFSPSSSGPQNATRAAVPASEHARPAPKDASKASVSASRIGRQRPASSAAAKTARPAPPHDSAPKSAASAPKRPLPSSPAPAAPRRSMTAAHLPTQQNEAPPSSQRGSGAGGTALPQQTVPRQSFARQSLVRTMPLRASLPTASSSLTAEQSAAWKSLPLAAIVQKGGPISEGGSPALPRGPAVRIVSVTQWGQPLDAPPSLLARRAAGTPAAPAASPDEPAKRATPSAEASARERAFRGARPRLLKTHGRPTASSPASSASSLSAPSDSASAPQAGGGDTGSRSRQNAQGTASSASSTDENDSGRTGKRQAAGSRSESRVEFLRASARREGTARPSRAPSPASLGTGGGAEAGGKGWTAALSSLGSSGASSKGAQAGSASAPPRTLPSAWLQSATQGPLQTAELASGWKAMELTLGSDNGTLTVKARPDADGVAVSVRVSEARLRSQLAANARRLQETMQGQYGSDVDLSFGGGSAGGSGGETPDESSSRRRSRPSSTPDSPSDSPIPDPSPRPDAPGRREWIG